MKVDNEPLTSFCDHRRNRRQVRTTYASVIPGVALLGPGVNVPALTSGDLRRPGSLPVPRSGGLAGDQRLQRDERKPSWLQRLLRLPAELVMIHRTASGTVEYSFFFFLTKPSEKCMLVIVIFVHVLYLQSAKICQSHFSITFFPKIFSVRPGA